MWQIKSSHYARDLPLSKAIFKQEENKADLLTIKLIELVSPPISPSCGEILTLISQTLPRKWGLGLPYVYMGLSVTSAQVLIRSK